MNKTSEAETLRAENDGRRSDGGVFTWIYSGDANFYLLRIAKEGIDDRTATP